MIKKIINFAWVGVVATAVDFALLYLFVEFFSLNELVAAALSFCVALAVNYLLSMKFVFTDRKSMSGAKQVLIFVFTALVGLGLNELFMWLCMDFLAIHYMVSKIIATAFVMVWNFLSRHFLLEK